LGQRRLRWIETACLCVVVLCITVNVHVVGSRGSQVTCSWISSYRRASPYMHGWRTRYAVRFSPGFWLPVPNCRLAGFLLPSLACPGAWSSRPTRILRRTVTWKRTKVRGRASGPADD
jgi:hypothetical protein